MKKTRLIAVLLAVIMVIVLAMMLLPKETEEEKPVEGTKKIIVAASEIPMYSGITADMLTTVDYPESLVPVGAYESKDELIGAVALVDMMESEILLKNHVVSADETPNKLSLNLEEGKRAMSISVDDVTGVCNLIKAGDHVDLIVSTKDLKQEILLELMSKSMMEDISDSGDDISSLLTQNSLDLSKADIDISEYLKEYEISSDRTIGLMLLQDVEVLALNQAMIDAPMDSNGKYTYSTVTLSLNPEDTVRLAWAMSDGKIYLALRAEGDTEIVEVEPFHVWDAMDLGSGKKTGGEEE